MADVAGGSSWLMKGVLKVTWSAMANDTDKNTGKAWTMPFLSDKTVQIAGTFDTSDAVVIEGSNDGTVYATLTDAQGSNLSATANFGPKTILQNPQFIRPRVTAGGTNGSIAVTIVAASMQR